MTHDGKFASGRFCSIECANSRVHSLETKRKIGLGVKLPRETRRCKQCTIEYSTYYDSTRQYCSSRCMHLHRKIEFRKNWSSKREYKANCQFRFSLNEYSTIEGHSLLAKLGMYHPVKNPVGVSRDHMLSITDGYLQNIPASIIAHPCNCRLIQHIDNQLKNSKSSITLKELTNKINASVAQ